MIKKHDDFFYGKAQNKMICLMAFKAAWNMHRNRTGSIEIELNEALTFFFVYYFGHALNILLSDLLESLYFLKDIFHTTYEMSNLLKKSPKRVCYRKCAEWIIWLDL